MNRFFSKLNLADIKIKAEGNSFPPDDDEAQQDEPVVAAEVPVKADVEQSGPAATFQYADTSVAEPIAEDAYIPADFTPETVESPANNNGQREYSYEESTALYSATESVNGNGHVVTEIVSDGIVIGIGEVLKVSARSRPSAVAGAIAGVVREAGKAEVQAIGAGATNQAIKAVAIARDYLSESGIEAVCVPAFIDVTIENEDRTAIRLVVEPR